MVTDDERRRVAERLRWLRDSDLPPWVGYTYEVVMGYMPKVGESSAYHESSYKEYVARLADLIDPGAAKAPTSSDATATRTDATATCDVSQSCRDTVACDPTERGVDSIYDWCRERLEGADGAEDELCCAIMRAIEDYRHPELVTAHTVRPVDREALLDVLDEMDTTVRCAGPDIERGYVESWAERIREALGVAS